MNDKENNDAKEINENKIKDKEING